MTREALIEAILEAVAPDVRNRILTNVTKSHMNREGAATARLDTRHHPQMSSIRSQGTKSAYKQKMPSAVAGSAVKTERSEVRSGPSGVRGMK